MVTLDEWLAGEYERLATFKCFWEKNVTEGLTTPDGDRIFPEKLPEGDWDDQYRSYESV